MPQSTSVQEPEDSFIYALRFGCFFLFLTWTILKSLLNLLQYCFCCMVMRRVGD